MKTHELKIWPEAFAAVRDGSKPYEVRSNLDRHFEVGDVLLLREWKPEHRMSGAPILSGSGRYTGEVAYREISYITRGGTFGLPTGVDVLGLARR